MLRRPVHLALLALLWWAAGAWAQTTPAENYAQGLRLRAALDAVPRATRTATQYTRALEAFRAVYHADRAAPEAAPSVEAVAELLAEEGRIFHNSALLRAAVTQLEFLRRNFSASPFAIPALLTEGEIAARDLHEDDTARARFSQFLSSYPRHELAPQARAELQRLGSAPPELAASTSPTSPGQASAPEPTPEKGAPSPTPAVTIHGVPVFRPAQGANLASVTGIRHWSTADYTRIAIDLGGNNADPPPFEASRVPGPDRIFFDIHGARLAPGLAGRAVTVADGGFLQRIRAAQFSGNVVRVVLDVSDVSDYSAFWLPNPSRLIIDVHGRARMTPLPAFADALPIPAPSPPPPDAALAHRDTPPTPGPNPEQAPAPTNHRHGNSIAKSPAQDNGEKARASASDRTQPVLNSDLPARTNGADKPSTVAQSPNPHTPSAAGAPTPRTTRPAAPGTFVSETAQPNAAPPGKPGNSAAAIAALSQQPARVRATPGPTTAPVADVARSPATDGGSPPTGKRRAELADAAPLPSPADPDSSGNRSLARALGLKINRIVVDAGHGGHDSGTLGPGGIREKDVVLNVALRLGKLLKQRLGADVTFTRDDDTFIPLETRTAIANKAQADLFISVHANSSPDASARGVETYYLNFTTSADALEVAARENAVSSESIHQLSDLVKKITLQDKIAESREFATDVEGSLYAGLEGGNAGLKDRGVKKAPFVVLIGANMPSILAEISFLTNPDDAQELRESAYKQRIAESLYKGIARYVRSLSGVRLEDTASSR